MEGWLFAGWIFMSLLVGWFAWTKTDLLDDMPLFPVFLGVIMWPVLLCSILAEKPEIRLPPYSEWQERRREAKIKRERPSEIAPAERKPDGTA